MGPGSKATFLEQGPPAPQEDVEGTGLHPKGGCWLQVETPRWEERKGVPADTEAPCVGWGRTAWGAQGHGHRSLGPGSKPGEGAGEHTPSLCGAARARPSWGLPGHLLRKSDAGLPPALPALLFV